MMKTTRTAYLKFLTIQRDVMRPIRERKKISVGSSKTAPIPRSSFSIRLKYSSTVMTGLEILADLEEEPAGIGKDDEIAEGRARHEERSR